MDPLAIPVEPSEAPEQQPAPEVPQTAPQAVSVEQFQQFQAQMLGSLEQLAGGLRDTTIALQRVGQPAPQAPVIDDVSAEQIQEALNRGEPIGDLIKKSARAEAQRLMAATKANDIDPVRDVGFTAMTQLVHDRLKQKPLYGRFQKELDEAFATLPDHMRVLPNNVEIIYRTVVGGHTDELLAEAEARGVAKAPAGGLPGPGGRALPTAPKGPDASEVFGKDALGALRELRRGAGKDFDTFCRDLGYEPEAYLALAKEMLDA